MPAHGFVRKPNLHVGQHVWTHRDNHFGWKCLLGVEPGSASISSHAAAARAKDLSRLPPTYLAVGALDLFLQENLEYVNRLAHAAPGLTYQLAYAAHYISQKFEPDNIGELLYQGVASTVFHSDLDNTLQGDLTYKLGSRLG